MALRSAPGRHEIELSNGEVATGRTVVIATGAQYRRLDVPRLEEFEGGGVYYAATQAEAQLCAGDPVVVVGGGNSAGQAAMFLSKHAASCRLLIRGDDLGKSMSRYLVDQIERNERSRSAGTPRWSSSTASASSRRVTVARHAHRRAHARIPAKALFVFIGASPHTEWLDGQLATDDAGFLLTGRDATARTSPSTTATAPCSWRPAGPGIFAVGDVRSGSIKRVASAVGRGVDGGPAGPRAPGRSRGRVHARVMRGRRCDTRS